MTATMNVKKGLSGQDMKDLKAIEKQIANGMPTFIRIGRLLGEILERRLYKLTHETWEDYCRQRWNWSRVHVWRQINAAREVDKMLPMGNIPANERQARAAIETKPTAPEIIEDAEVEQVPFGKLPEARQLEILHQTRERLQGLAILQQRPPEQTRRYDRGGPHFQTAINAWGGVACLEEITKQIAALVEEGHKIARENGLG